jgi:ribonuclease-3
MDARPADLKPADAKLVEPTPAEARPAEAKPAEAAPVRSVDKHRGREVAPLPAVSAPSAPASTEHEPGVADAVQTRVADAGH